MRDALEHLRSRDPALLGAVLFWAFQIAVLWAAFHAFGDAPPLAVLVQAFFVGMLGNLLPMPGGVGGVEGGMIGAFVAFGVDSGLAVVAVLVYRAFTFWLPLVPGVIAYFRLRRTVERWRPERAALGSRAADGYTIQTEVTKPGYGATDTKWQNEQVIIIGSGPAGYTAALYTARANLSPLVIEGFLWGGLLQQTTEVENYPGFREGIMGPELMQTMRDQAERFGARFLTDNATRFEPAAEEGGLHTVWVDDEAYKARTVILAMGAEHKKLGVPGEEELANGRGVSYCATCDAAFFKDRETIIVGGGDSAMEEAIFLAKFSSKVTIVHRRDEFRASQIMLDRAKATENIELLTPYVVEEFLPGEDGPLGSARLRNVETGEEREIPMAGAFVAIGHEPQSEIVDGHGRHRRRRLRRRRGPLDAHERAGRVRRRRPRRPHVPPGRHRGGHGLPGGARRRVVPARQPARPDAGRARGHGRPRRGAVVATTSRAARSVGARRAQRARSS